MYDISHRLRYSVLNNGVTLKFGFVVVQGHWKCCPTVKKTSRLRITVYKCDSIAKRKKKFVCKYAACNIDICSVFVNNALDELSQLSGS